MDFAFILEDYLSTATSVSAIVGQASNARLFHHLARQMVSYPMIVIDETGGTPSEHLSGTTGIAQEQYTIWSFGLTVVEATNLWSEIRQNLEKYGPALMGSTYVHEVALDNDWRERGFYAPQDASQQIVYYCASRYSIWHAVPIVPSLPVVEVP